MAIKLKEQMSLLLKEYRSSKGLTQENLARMVGVALYSVQRWEQMDCYPSPLVIKEMKRLGILSPDD